MSCKDSWDDNFKTNWRDFLHAFQNIVNLIIEKKIEMKTCKSYEYNALFETLVKDLTPRLMEYFKVIRMFVRDYNKVLYAPLTIEDYYDVKSIYEKAIQDLNDHEYIITVEPILN